MPKIETILRKHQVAQPVLADLTPAILPMALDLVGKEVEDDEEPPVRSNGVDTAFRNSDHPLVLE